MKVAEHYWLETLGCPKNQVDSDKLAGRLAADGYVPAESPADADLVVVNTCAFIEAARQESVDMVLELAAARRGGARLVVTGCLAQRYGDELAAAIPEVDMVAGFGVPVTLGAAKPVPTFDLLELPRPPVGAPWAYVKVAEGCDRRCGFCAIPSFRGPQRSRPLDSVLAEVDELGGAVREVVLVAQDLASWGMDRASLHQGARSAADSASRPLVRLTRELSERVERVRLLYLYPSSLDEELVSAILSTGVPYFDLSLQHVSRPLLARMRRFGNAELFLERIESIRKADPEATLRSSFILGYPGETEEDHDLLLEFIVRAELDWAGFFTFSEEPGTHAAGFGSEVARVPEALALERLRECAELQDALTARRRRDLVGTVQRVLVDSPGVARSHREAPEIDGIIEVPQDVPVGSFADVEVVEAMGTDLRARPVRG
ncbi:MAG: MiaB/RimO family radical SAM methylthiotransferase [Acidimicrobiales bacterium]